jgi:hypothetical protein
MRLAAETRSRHAARNACMARVCRRRGVDFEEIVAEQEREEKLIKAAGLSVTIGVPGAPTIGGAKPAPAAEPDAAPADQPPQEGQ